MKNKNFSNQNNEDYKNINLNNKNNSEYNIIIKIYEILLKFIDNYYNSYLFKITFLNIHIFINFNIIFFIYNHIVNELKFENNLYM